MNNKHQKISSLALIGVMLGSMSLAPLTGCKDYDDDIDGLQAQIDKNKDAIKSLEDAIKKGALISKVEAVEGGYKITFSDGNAIEIKHGEQGEQGLQGIQGIQGIQGPQGLKGDPAIPAKFKVQGNVWMVSLDGGSVWITVTDENGDPVKATGTPGNTPMLEVRNDYWWVSTDNGANWEQLKDAVTNQPVKAAGSTGSSIVPKFKSDAEGYWMVATGGDDNFIYVTDGDGNKVSCKGADGADGSSVEINEDGVIVSVVKNPDGTTTKTPTTFQFDKVLPAITEDVSNGCIVISLPSKEEGVSPTVYTVPTMALFKGVAINNLQAPAAKVTLTARGGEVTTAFTAAFDDILKGATKLPAGKISVATYVPVIVNPAKADITKYSFVLEDKDGAAAKGITLETATAKNNFEDIAISGGEATNSRAVAQNNRWELVAKIDPATFADATDLALKATKGDTVVMSSYAYSVEINNATAVFTGANGKISIGGEKQAVFGTYLTESAAKYATYLQNLKIVDPTDGTKRLTEINGVKVEYDKGQWYIDASKATDAANNKTYTFEYTYVPYSANMAPATPVTFTVDFNKPMIQPFSLSAVNYTLGANALVDANNGLVYVPIADLQTKIKALSAADQTSWYGKSGNVTYSVKLGDATPVTMGIIGSYTLANGTYTQNGSTNTEPLTSGVTDLGLKISNTALTGDYTVTVTYKFDNGTIMTEMTIPVTVTTPAYTITHMDGKFIGTKTTQYVNTNPVLKAYDLADLYKEDVQIKGGLETAGGVTLGTYTFVDVAYETYDKLADKTGVPVVKNWIDGSDKYKLSSNAESGIERTIRVDYTPVGGTAVAVDEFTLLMRSEVLPKATGNVTVEATPAKLTIKAGESLTLDNSFFKAVDFKGAAYRLIKGSAAEVVDTRLADANPVVLALADADDANNKYVATGSDFGTYKIDAASALGQIQAGQSVQVKLKLTVTDDLGLTETVPVMVTITAAAVVE